MNVENEFFHSASLLDMHLLDDDFVAAGSSGTASAKRKGKKRGGGGGRPDRMVDVALLRSQFTSRLVSHRTFCEKALKEAKAASDDFLAANKDIHQKYRDLVINDVSEVVGLPVKFHREAFNCHRSCLGWLS